MAKSTFAKFTAGGLVLAIVVFGSIWAPSKWQSSRKAELESLTERKALAIKRVQLSRLGTQELRDQIASEFFGEVTTTEGCDWNAYPTWNRRYKNPNWISETKGIDGFHVICETNARDQHESDIEFDYEFVDSFGIVGLKWGYPRGYD